MYKIKGGKKALIQAIFQGSNIKCFINKNIISWEVSTTYYTHSIYDYTFNNIYNWNSKKQVEREALNYIFSHFDYIEEKLK